MKFDPNAASTADSGIFGLPFTEKEAALVYLPVPWEATTSYGGGASEGPRAILEASRQVDLFDADVLRPYEPGLHLLPESETVKEWNRRATNAARREGDRALVNELGERLNGFVREETARLLKGGKLVGVVGGDHSVPFGALQAMAAQGDFGVLHVDAHSDTRKAYEGFRWSHASIMYNVLEEIPQVTSLVQVGIRDYCEEEWEYVTAQGERVAFFSDAELTRRKFEGESWDRLAGAVVERLPDRVWISFDIDGLDPRFCPHTGTPVPGGLDFKEAVHLIGKLVRSGRRIVGFDLNEVAPHPEGKEEWDGNVGARLLYKLSAFTLASQGLVSLRK